MAESVFYVTLLGVSKMLNMLGLFVININQGVDNIVWIMTDNASKFSSTKPEIFLNNITLSFAVFFSPLLHTQYKCKSYNNASQNVFHPAWFVLFALLKLISGFAELLTLEFISHASWCIIFLMHFCNFWYILLHPNQVEHEH